MLHAFHNRPAEHDGGANHGPYGQRSVPALFVRQAPFRLMVRTAMVGALMAAASQAAQLGDVNGDGRVSFGDAHILKMWQQTGSNLFHPAPGSADLEDPLPCSSERYVPRFMIVFLEALRRYSVNPLPHFIERWPEGLASQAEPPTPDSSVRVELLPVRHVTGSERVTLRFRIRNQIPLSFFAVLIDADGIDFRPPHPVHFDTQDLGRVLSSTEYYLLSGGLFLCHPEELNHPFSRRTWQPSDDGHVFEVVAVVAKKTGPGSYPLRLRPGTEVVTPAGEVVVPEVAGSTLEITREIETGLDLPFPPLEFADLDARTIAGEAEIRAVGAEGFPGDEVMVKFQMRATRPVNYVQFYLGFDERVLESRGAEPLYIDPEHLRVTEEDHRIIVTNGVPRRERSGYVSYTYYPYPSDDKWSWYYSPYDYPSVPPSLKFLAPLGEWIDLFQVRMFIRETAAGFEKGALRFWLGERNRISRSLATFVPYGAAGTNVMSLNCEASRDAAELWEQSTSFAEADVTVLGGGDPPPPAEPPIPVEEAGIAVLIGPPGVVPPPDDTVAASEPVLGTPGAIVRLPVYVAANVKLWQFRFAFGFDPQRFDRVGFEVNFLDFDGRLFTADIWRDGDRTASNYACETAPDGGQECDPGRLPYHAIIYGDCDHVPEDAILFDVATGIDHGFAEGQTVEEYWEARKLYHVGNLLLQVREGTTEGMTEIAGRTVEWHPDCTGPTVFPKTSVTSGYPPVIDEWRQGRFDVPAQIVRKGVVVFSKDLFRFLRGDSNGDENLDLSDAVSILSALFLGTVTLDCEDAADADDDGTVIVTDAIYLLNHLFIGGPQPAPPYPEVGADPTEDDLRCTRI